MQIVQLLILLLVAVLITSLTKKKVLRVVLALVFSILFTLQMTAVKLTGTVADYKFYEHANFENIFVVGSLFLTDILFAILALVISFAIIFYASSHLRKFLNSKKLIFIAALGVVFLSLDGMMINNLASTLSLKYGGSSSNFHDALSKLPIDYGSYTFQDDLTSDLGTKNLVFISLESFEYGFINDRPELTPNMNKLKETYSFKKMLPSPGGEWTSASVYMSLTGMPAYFGRNGNQIFQKSNEMKLVSVGDVLSKANYNMSYLMGNKEFSGMNDMLETIGFTVKSELDFKKKYKKTKWGINDKDLFEEIKTEILLLNKKEKPFALFASTISTHFPNGVYDARMKDVIPERDSELEFMVSAVDYLIGDLIKFLEKERLLNETVFIVVPDHTFMGNHKTVDAFSERSLFVLSNTPKENIVKDNFSQISLPGLIIKYLNINSNAVFISDLVTGNKNLFLNDYKNELKNVNVSSLEITTIEDGCNISFESSYLVIKDSEDKVVDKTKTSLLKTSSIVYELDDFKRLKNKKTIHNKNLKSQIKIENTLLIHVTKDKNISVFYTDSDGITTFVKNNELVELRPSMFDIKLPEDQQEKDVSQVYITSSSWNAKKTSMVYCLDQSAQLTRGMNVTTVSENGNINVTNFDTHGNPESIAKMLAKIDVDLKDKQQVFIVAHDSPGNAFINYETQLKNMKLFKMITLKERQAYIAEVKPDQTVEHVNDLTVEQSFSIPKIKVIKKAAKNDSLSIKKYSKDTSRFIAHAGGSIDNKIYTNSLNALNENYRKGFKLFEIDFIKSSDGHYIATHDWKTWKEQTSYKGTTPVSLEVFKSQKIYGEYQALGMKEINEWFDLHKDAILVTDKVNEPLDFSNAFIDKSRLRMELFSKASIDEALKNGIIPIVSENVINNLGEAFKDYVKEKNIKYIAISRASIKNKQTLLNELAQLGVKCYVFHVNFKEGKDEKYVIENEIGIIYGLYADKWNFKEE